MKLTHLEYAVMVKHCHSISKAAEKLYISQPALSEQITVLEEKLGFPIFKRTNKGVEATFYGEKFLSDAEEILSISKKWKEYEKIIQAEELGGNLAEKVSIVLTPSLCDVFMVDIFSKLEEMYKNLSIEVFQMPTEDILKFLLRENISLGLFSIEEDRVHEFEESFRKNNYETRFLYKDELVLAVSNEDQIARETICNLFDLSGYTLVTIEEKPSSIINTKYSSYFSKHLIFPKVDNLLKVLLRPGNVAIFSSRAMEENYLVQHGMIKLLHFSENVTVIENHLISRKEAVLTIGEKILKKEILSKYY